ncbi:EEP domain-containing protein [Agrobacterium vitis]|uniref:endonuclease/exonuclease/phosphatase family protein n=1 Tax=Agrobacterium vitis TaxID=373 RepID=UPI0008DC00AB|nr:endonuclease/exonuclease/phosphatase family protein [Agrobacterium vitis]MUO81978.1 EEP domain-containing protein [Agrobacterium vitis]MUO97009.1 EEP domain-containing protein [Agrobacterium vitis]MVA93255.1 EEP domain-containing protein [Agrobacterium vitis]NSY12588.1 endonuclease/exonuclease/phosphatase family protein [Agrobacterium vitis]NSY22345.1 endonuclease/exonuclease/phosphatase family protein [Agrobacterium vitis]
MKKQTHSLRTQMLTSLRNRRSRPLTSNAGGREAETPGLLVASYNVHKCVGVDGRFDPERIAHVIREIGPDVIALQEADQRFGERNGLLDLSRLQGETGLTRVPVAGLTKSHGWRGNVLLFREGVVRDVHPFVLPGLEPRGAVVAEIELNGGRELRIIAAHLGLLRWARRQQADFILKLMRERADCPTVLMGDFNEWRVGPGSALTRLEPLFGPLPPPVPSFPARLPVLALDRIMTNRPGLIADMQVHDSPLARLASDHLPLKAWIDLDKAVEAVG